LLEIIRRDNVTEYVEPLKKSIQRKELVIIIGECSVDYTGRSESKLTSGERIVIIKQDGALLIHRPTGYSPVNWQPSTTIIEVREHDNKLVLTAIRDKPREIVNIYFTRIEAIIHGKLVDHGEFVMYMDELDMRDILFEHPELIEEGLRIKEKEKQVNGGSIDLFGYDKNNKPVIIELKRVTAGREAVLQLYNYVKTYTEKTGIRPRGILVAPSFTSSAIEALNRLKLEWKEIDLRRLWSLKKEKEVKHTSLLKYLSRNGEKRG